MKRWRALSELIALSALIGLASCAHAPVKSTPPPHLTAAIFFHTCGIVTAIELVNSEGHVYYFDWYRTADDTFAEAVEEADSLGDSAVDIEVMKNCMKA